MRFFSLQTLNALVTVVKSISSQSASSRCGGKRMPRGIAPERMSSSSIAARDKYIGADSLSRAGFQPIW